MPALVADIAAGTRTARIESVSDAAILARYPRARDGSEQPAEGFFDVALDALTAITARKALLGVERRRFKVVAEGLNWIDPSIEHPSIRLIDSEQALDGTGMITRFELSLEDGTTTYEVFA